MKCQMSDLRFRVLARGDVAHGGQMAGPAVRKIDVSVADLGRESRSIDAPHADFDDLRPARGIRRFAHGFVIVEQCVDPDLVKRLAQTQQDMTTAPAPRGRVGSNVSSLNRFETSYESTTRNPTF